MEQLSVAELQRNLHRLNDFDIIELIDKRKGEIRGYLINKKYRFLIESIESKPSYSLAGALKKYKNPNLIEKERQ